jgi:hypothetical protein
MASLDSLLIRNANAEKAVRRTTEGAGVVLRIKHVGTGTTQTPTVVLSSTASVLTLTDGASAATVIDLSAATTNSVGEVADYINGLSSWKCKVMDALRSDLIDNLLTDGSVTSAVVNGETVFDCLQVIASAKLQVRVAYDETVGALKPKGSHRVTLNGFSTYSTCTGGAGTLAIYDCDTAGKTETQIWQGLGVNNTLLTYSPSSSSYPFSGITAKEGHELVIVVSGTVTTAPTTNYLQAEFVRE